MNACHKVLSFNGAVTLALMLDKNCCRKMQPVPYSHVTERLLYSRKGLAFFSDCCTVVWIEI